MKAPNMTTPTPRSDAALLVPYTDGTMRKPDASCIDGDPMFVPASFARQLETELAEANAELEGLGIHTCHENCQRPACVLRRERDSARKELAEADFATQQERNIHMTTIAERDQLRARAEKAEALLGKLQEMHGCSQEMVVLWCEHAVKRGDQLRAELLQKTQQLAAAKESRDKFIEWDGWYLVEPANQCIVYGIQNEITTAIDAAAKEDTDRLDWLEGKHDWILCAESESPTFSIGSNKNFQMWALKVPTVRAAIDQARKEGSK